MGSNLIIPPWPDAGRITIPPPGAYCYGGGVPRRRRQQRRPWIYDESTGLWYAAVTIDSFNGSGGVIGPDNVTFQLNNVAGTFMLASIALYGTGNTVTSATYKSISLSAAITPISSDNGAFNQAVWKLASPATGTWDVEVHIATANNFIVTVYTFTGVDLITPLGTPTRNGYAGSGITHSQSITNLANGLILDCFCIDSNAGTITPKSGQLTVGAATDADVLRSIITTKTGTGSLSLGYDWLNDFYRWAQASISINPLTATSAPPAFGRQAVKRAAYY